MKLAITADVHFGVEGRLDDIEWSVRVIREYCANAGIDTIMVCGDLWHNRKSFDIEVMSRVCNFFEEATEKYNQSWITFPGNHDMFLRHTWRINSLQPLRKYLTVIDDVKIIQYGDRRFWILPFVTYERSYMTVLSLIEQQYEDGDILLTHIGVRGSILNTCFLMKDWSFVSFDDSRFQHVFTGHFHSKQQVGHNVWYPGSPIPFKFDEGDVPHGFYVFDTETNNIKFVDIWKAGSQFFPNEKQPPQFITVDDNNINSITKPVADNSMIRVILKREYGNDEKLQIKEHLNNLGAKTVRWLNKIPETVVEENRDLIIQAMNDKVAKYDLFEIWLKTQKNVEKQYNVQILRRLNNEIVTEGEAIYLEENDV
jgi:DNA repair exonuclease SbcCD nuclease subunit